MKATYWFGSSALAMALLGGIAGCGGSAAMNAPPPSSGGNGVAAPAPMAPMAEAYEPGAAKGADMAEAAPSQAPGASGSLGAPSTSMRPPSEMRRESEGAAKPTDQRQAQNRPGLATQWGETRHSSITTVPFVRAEPMNPFGMTSLFYNDEQGARAMANASGFRRLQAQTFTLANGAVAVGLRGEGGGFLNGFVAGEKTFAIGQPGQRYSIVLRNLTPTRVECVVSVDGLDVLDGQAASFSKRGYLLDPHGEVEIDGFRQSMDTVAAFRFGSVRSSYANQKHGDTRNVGVIGVALFHERGTNPWTGNEIQRRQDANPFPGQFATPPGQ